MRLRKLLAAAGAICAVSMLLVGCTGTVATEGPVEAEPTATDIPFPATTPFPPEAAERLHAIRDSVAAIRGLPVNPDVVEGIITEEALKAYSREAYASLEEEDRRQLEVYEVVFRMLRLIEADDDLESLLTDDSSEQVAGLYVSKEKRLVLLAEEQNGGVNEEFILAHEYTHSLQDAKYDLVALQELSEEDERTELATTTSCVVEGDASLAAVHYLNEKYGEGWGELLDDEPEDEDPDLPPALQRYMLFDYSECLVFVLTMQLLKGWDGVNALLEEPPVSTEQILHPERYIKGEQPLSVDVPDLEKSLDSSWSLLEGGDGAYGEFDTFVYLATAGVPEGEAKDAAEGWGGGYMQVYTAGEGESQDVLVHIALAWDSQDDWQEFWVAYTKAIGMLGYDESQTSTAVWTFNGPGDYGSAVWDQDALRVDILISTERAALEKAVEATRSAGAGE